MLIEALTGDRTIKHKFNPSTTLPVRDSRWTKLESQQMAKNKYRDSYLPKFKANQSTKRANTAKSSKSVKLSSKKIIKPKPKPKM